MRKLIFLRNSLLEHRKKTLGTGLLLLLMAFGSQALTLGRASSTALIGRSLDLAIAVRMEAGETAAALCFEADVFHGDVRQDPSRVKVLVEPAAQPNSLNVRVQSATTIDEPVVTVYLRTGCGQKTTRRYVLLADFPSEVAAPAVPLVTPAPIAAPARTPATVTAAAAPVSTAPAAERPASGNAPDKAAAPRAPRASSPQAASKRPPVKAAQAARAPADTVRPVQRPVGGPRLELDPLEFLSDRIANLDGEMTFEAPPDALQSIEKIKTLEESLKSLRLLAAKNEASLNALQARLQQEEASGFSRQAGYALVALALVCLAAMAVAVVLWRRQGQGQVSAEWWDDAAPPGPVREAEEDIDTQPSRLPITPAPSKWPASVQSRHKAPAPSDFGPSAHKRSGFGVDVNLTEMSDSAFRDFMPTGMRSGMGSKLADLPTASIPQARPARNLNSDAVLDIRQQAEFFVSLGQSERAAQLLRREIKESSEPNPFVYLDLLALFHSLGLKGEFQQLRESFELLFCCRIPAFTFFKNRSLDLESYPDVLANIVALWPQPGVLAWLEGCIFQNPEKGGSPGFDLAAFKDLLFLHAVARILVETPGSQEGVSPKAAPAPAAPAVATRAQPMAQPVELPPFDALDLDLSSPPKLDENDPQPAYSLGEQLPFLIVPDPRLDKPVKRS